MTTFVLLMVIMITPDNIETRAVRVTSCQEAYHESIDNLNYLRGIGSILDFGVQCQRITFADTRES